MLEIRKKIQVFLKANAGQSWVTSPLFFLKTGCPNRVSVVLGNRATANFDHCDIPQKFHIFPKFSLHYFMSPGKLLKSPDPGRILLSPKTDLLNRFNRFPSLFLPPCSASFIMSFYRQI